MTPVRIAAFGAGWVTTHRHIPTMQEIEGFEVVALVDRDLRRAQEAARPFSVPARQGSSVDDLADLDAVDAITCGTAPFAHHSVIRAALERGKHVLTEKPFTMTVEEGVGLVELAEAKGLTLAIVHNFQFASSARRLRRWIDEGRLGTPRAIWAVQLSNPRRRLPVWFDELPLGLFYDESPHLLYLVRAFAGSPVEVRSVTSHPSTNGLRNTPAHLDVQLASATGLPITMQMSFEAPLSEWHLAVLGDEGVGTIDVFRDIAFFVPNDGLHLGPAVLRSSLRSTLGHWAGTLRSGVGHARGTLRYGNEEVFARFRDAIRSSEEPEGIGGREALAVLRLQHQIIAAAT